MKKKIVFVMIALLAVSFSFAAKKPAKKTKAPAKTASAANPLLGTWVGDGAYIIVSPKTIKIVAQRYGANEITWELYSEANYKYSPSPLKLTDVRGHSEGVGPNGRGDEIGNVDMTYTLKDDVLSIGYDLSSIKTERELSISAKQYKCTKANALTGTWTTGKGSDIRFFGETVTINITDPDTDDRAMLTGTFKYSKSPLKIKVEETGVELTMKYKITGKKITYRFLNTTGKEYEGIEKLIFQKMNKKSKKMADADFTGTKKADHKIK